MMRRWLRFSFRTLLVFVTACCALLAWQLNDGLTNDEFWAFIENADKTSWETLEADMHKLSRQELLDFNAFFSHYHRAFDYDDENQFEIWNLGAMCDGGMGDDSWTDFQTWIILQGKTVFENAFRDSESLIEPIVESEGMYATEYWNGVSFVFEDRFPDYYDRRPKFLQKWDDFRTKRVLRTAPSKAEILALREVTHMRRPYNDTYEQLNEWYPKAYERFIKPFETGEDTAASSSETENASSAQQ